MQANILIKIFVITSAAAGLFLIAGGVFSQSADDIQYPISVLGSCKNKADCKAYCDISKNADACLDFAQKNKMMSEEEVKTAKNFIAAGSKGPGGCSGKEACEQYCNDISRINVCLSYAEENNLMPPKELEEAKKVKAAIERGVKPPACKNKEECDVYCEDSSHMEECINFAAEAGFMQGKELEDAQKMLKAVKNGVIPPPCKGKEACDAYCSSPDNMEVCMNFAMEAGLMNEEEKANSQKMLQAIKKGVKPPACKGKEECDVYCGQDEHLEECMNFAEAAGFMTAEEAKMARKTGGKGPGGCKTKEDCEAFCNNPDNQEACFNFAKDNGMMPAEDLKQMEEGKQQMQRALEQMPPAVAECLNSGLGPEMLEKIKNGTAMPSRAIGDKMGECFQKNMPPREPGQEGMTPSRDGQMQPPRDGSAPPQNQSGPGGCSSPEECRSYCESNPESCRDFQPPSGSETQQPGIPSAGNFPPRECLDPNGCQYNQPPNNEYPNQFQPPPGEQPQYPPPSNLQQQYQPPPQQMQNSPCEGDACQGGLLPGQPLQQPLEGSVPVPMQPLPLQQAPAPQQPIYQDAPVIQQPASGQQLPPVQAPLPEVSPTSINLIPFLKASVANIFLKILGF